MSLSFFFLSMPQPPTSTLFPYTTLFRSPRLPCSLCDKRGRGLPYRRILIRPLPFPVTWASIPFPVLAGLLPARRSEEHTSELQSHSDLVCRLLLEKKTAHGARPPRRPNR